MTLGSNMQPVKTFQTTNGGLGGGFAEFSSSGMSPAMSGSMQTPAKPAAMPDAFSKLVSLDASALTPGAKREEALRPSLNSLGSAQPSGGSIGFGGANYSSGGMLQPMQITTQQRSHPQQSKPQSSIQPQLFF
ncbi:hypothetical protein BASA60_007379 [Batrachochytrium salamandrivorans]|nr:hypothetical protein BASA60_007379 [Batrachochytrium salamandrivorans]